MTGGPVTSPWHSCPKPNPRASLRLFCFPYAGATAHIFRHWPDGLPPTVEVCSIQLPGRGRRLREPPLTRLSSLVPNIAQELLPYLEKPFAVFGHSLGAAIAFELARYLRKAHTIQPSHLFVSGYRAPQILGTEPFTYDLPEAEFLEELRRLNGTPSKILEHPELMRLIIPILRADFEMSQTYVYSPEAPPLDCPITAFGGLQDENVSAEHLEGWRDQTTGRFSLQMLPGDHFFLETFQPLLLQILSSELGPPRKQNQS